MPKELLNWMPAIGDDNVERVTTQAVFDVLEVPQRARRAVT
jgi:hypothetical protein